MRKRVFNTAVCGHRRPRPPFQPDHSQDSLLNLQEAEALQYSGTRR
jgi:hypothetical protein